MRVEEHTITLGESPVFYRRAPPPEAGEAIASSGKHDTMPVVYVHGMPGSSEDWTSLLARTGGVAPDLLGFGRTAKGGHLEYSPEALADFLDALLTELSVDRFHLVLHGWGAAAGSLLAARAPDRVERLVLFSPVPLLDGLSWPWWARLWRVRGVGELAMGATTKTVLTRALRRGSVSKDAWPPERVARVWEQFDQGTQRAILRLQRSVDEERTQAMESALETLQMPALIIWGDRDPWWSSDVAEAYAARLGHSQVRRAAAAGHWPWLDDPALADLVVAFLGANAP